MILSIASCSNESEQKDLHKTTTVSSTQAKEELTEQEEASILLAAEKKAEEEGTSSEDDFARMYVMCWTGSPQGTPLGGYVIHACVKIGKKIFNVTQSFSAGGNLEWSETSSSGPCTNC